MEPLTQIMRPKLKVSCREYEYVLTRNFIHLAGLSKEQYTQFIFTLTFLLFI